MVASRALFRASARRQRGGKVSQQILARSQPDGKPDEGIGNASLQALVPEPRYHGTPTAPVYGGPISIAVDDPVFLSMGHLCNSLE